MVRSLAPSAPADRRLLWAGCAALLLQGLVLAVARGATGGLISNLLQLLLDGIAVAATLRAATSELLLGPAQGTARTNEAAYAIHHASERAAGLVRQLLAFSRQQHLSPRTLDLNQSVSGIYKMLRRLTRRISRSAWSWRNKSGASRQTRASSSRSS